MRLGQRTARPISVSFLGYHIRCVIGMCADKVMRWIATRWIVTAVADQHAFWNGAVCQFVSNAVGQKRLTAFANVNTSVAINVPATLPFPALVWAKYLHLCPKAFRKRAKTGIVPVNKANRLTFYMAAPVFVPCRDAGLFATTTLAITVRDFVRGNMGLHRNLPFCAKSQGVPAPLGQLFSSFNYTTGGTV